MSVIQELQNIKGFIQVLSKSRVLTIVFLSVTAGVLDVVGIASIFPLIAFLSDSEQILNQFDWLLNLLEFNGVNPVLALSSLFLSFFSLSVVWRALTGWYFLHIAKHLEAQISIQFFNEYLRASIASSLQRQQATERVGILGESSNIANGIILPLLNLASYIFLVSLFFVVFIWIYGGLAFGIFTSLLIVFLSLYFMIKTALVNAGKRRLVSNEMRFKIVEDAITNLKFLKFYKLERHYVDLFKGQADEFAVSQVISGFLVILPKYVFEIMIALICGLLISMGFLMEWDWIELGAHLALMLGGAYRVAPAIQQIQRNLSIIQYNQATIANFSKKLFDSMEFNHRVDKRDGAQHEFLDLTWSNCSFGYKSDNQKAVLVNEVDSFLLKQGDCIALCGPTGCGKTSFLNVLTGIMEPFTGAVELNGEKISWSRYNQYISQVAAYIPQESVIISGSIIENLSLGNERAYEHPEKFKVEAATMLREVYLYDELQKEGDPLKVRLDLGGLRLSGGQRQKLGLARALLQRPKILFIDEGTSACDSLTEQLLLKKICDTGATCVLVTHNKSNLPPNTSIFEM